MDSIKFQQGYLPIIVISFKDNGLARCLVKIKNILKLKTNDILFLSNDNWDLAIAIEAGILPIFINYGKPNQLSDNCLSFQNPETLVEFLTLFIVSYTFKYIY